MFDVCGKKKCDLWFIAPSFGYWLATTQVSTLNLLDFQSKTSPNPEIQRDKQLYCVFSDEVAI